MQLIPDWRHVLRKAWSVRLILAAGVLSGCEVALPLIADWLPVRPGTFALLSSAATAGAFVMRVVAQANLRSRP